MKETTFGGTPAAKYLAQYLSEYQNAALVRSVGKRITATATQVRELVTAYQCEYLSAKTVANSLRLMREDISFGDSCGEELVDQLTRNVQIGHIKRGMRICQFARKFERVMVDPENRAREVRRTDQSGYEVSEYLITDRQSGKELVAGRSFYSVDEDVETARVTSIAESDSIPEVTAAILQDRSDRRLKRLNKHQE